MRLESGLIFDKAGRSIHFHLPIGRGTGSLPDSDDLWDRLWDNRENLGGFAHTHPWDGAAWFSSTDKKSFRAIEAGLGKRLLWPIVTFTETCIYKWSDAAQEYIQVLFEHEIEGLETLRRLSGKE